MDTNLSARSYQNSAEIIHLSPSTLFACQSFTGFLTPDSTDTFLDAVDALDDADPPSSASSDDDSNAGDDENKPPPQPSLPHPEHFRITILGSAADAKNHLPSDSPDRPEVHLHASLHRPEPAKRPSRTLLELELVDDVRNPLKQDRLPASPEELNKDRRLHDPPREQRHGMDPTADEIYRSTVSLMKPIRALNKKRSRREPEINMVQLVFQIEEQLRKAKGLETFLSASATTTRA